MRDLISLNDAWRQSTEDERRALAESLVRALPSGFRFVAVGGRHSVATFARAGRTFAFVPGGRFAIGWSTDGWQPNADEVESYMASAEEYGFAMRIAEYVAQATRPRRAVDVPPMLVETTAHEVGWRAVDRDHPDLREAMDRVEKSAGPYVCTIHRDNSELRVRKLADGTVHAEEAIPGATHAELARRLEAEGFRFPTSDEWEYLCGGGAPTLFRWGEHAPCDRYPTDVSPEEVAWRREWALSGGKLERPVGGFRSDWELHHEPKALGLAIAINPYTCELVAEPDITRGGDGGGTICGGAGFFLGWLTLATAYFEEHACRRNAEEPVQAGFTVARRVLTLM